MSTNLQTININLPIGSLEAYIAMVSKIPLLSREEESDLATRFYQEQNIEAARHLVLSHLRYVIRIARTYKGYGLALGDLIQEGNIGLMKAVKRFNPSIGVRLISFAVHWIKAEIQEYILRNWRIVKVATTKAQRKLFFNLRKAKQKLGWFSQNNIKEVAANLDVKEATVREMETRLAAHDISFDLPTDADDNDEQQTATVPAFYLEDRRYDPAHLLEYHDSTENNQDKLQNALAGLDKRSQHIVMQRWLTEPKATLQDLANYYNVSAERIRQLEQNAMKRLRNAIEEVA